MLIRTFMECKITQIFKTEDSVQLEQWTRQGYVAYLPILLFRIFNCFFVQIALNPESWQANIKKEGTFSTSCSK
jgi:preprotein translocase subunit SecY